MNKSADYTSTEMGRDKKEKRCKYKINKIKIHFVQELKNDDHFWESF